MKKTDLPDLTTPADDGLTSPALAPATELPSPPNWSDLKFSVGTLQTGVVLVRDENGKVLPSTAAEQAMADLQALNETAKKVFPATDTKLREGFVFELVKAMVAAGVYI